VVVEPPPVGRSVEKHELLVHETIKPGGYDKDVSALP
jgi:hypothetical protein